MFIMWPFEMRSLGLYASPMSTPEKRADMAEPPFPSSFREISDLAFISISEAEDATESEEMEA